MLSVQSKSPSLAGLLLNVMVENLTKPHLTSARVLTNVNVLNSKISSSPKVSTGKNLIKLNVLSAPIFINLGAMESLSANQNEKNIDVSSQLMPFNIPQSQGCIGSRHSAKESAQCCGSEHRAKVRPMFESYIAVIPASKKVQNSDLYGDSLLSFETTTRDCKFLESIKKRSTYSCVGQKADKKRIADSVISAKTVRPSGRKSTPHAPKPQSNLPPEYESYPFNDEPEF